MIRTQTRSSAFSENDPLSLVLRPPPSETEQEKKLRVRIEAEAKLQSDRIDEQIRLEEREMLKKRKSEIKLLLLGQAESGKSTLQKQFQLMYAPTTLDEERASWRSVVYFNVVRTIRRILDAVDYPESSREFDRDGDSDSIKGGSILSSSPGAGTLPLSSEAQAQLARLRDRLAPLYDSETKLSELMSGGVTLTESARRRGTGAYVRTGWQARALVKHGERRRKSTGSDAIVVVDDGLQLQQLDKELIQVADLLNSREQDIRTLWTHPVVRVMIEKRQLKLEDSAEFFLNDIKRVATNKYIPTIDDVLRARLQTMGIATHTFNLTLNHRNFAWNLYDVGGARGQRHTWISYFDDADAIIFIAPVSAFDQYLEEDGRVNRIHDSLQLFTQICSNELLKKVHLVLFLNKTDILKAKIEAGISVKKYITSYGDRPNDFESVLEYFRSHFNHVHRKNNDANRILYAHFTSVIDTKTTQGIIANVRDSIFRRYLKDASLV